MAQVTKTYKENGGDYRATWVLRCVGYNKTANNNTVTFNTPSVWSKYINDSGATKSAADIQLGNAVVYVDNSRIDYISGAYEPGATNNDTKWYPNSERLITSTGITHTVNTGSIFNSTNKSTRYAYIYLNSNVSRHEGWLRGTSHDGYYKGSGDGIIYIYDSDKNKGTINNVYIGKIGPLGTITLDAPPIINCSSSLDKDTSGYYAGYTNVSLNISGIRAQYGGDITSVTLTVGSVSKTVTTTSSAISLKLSSSDGGKSITPIVTAKDSRGQTSTKTLSSISILDYIPPSLTYSIDRINNSFVKDDEGTNGLITAKISFDEPLTNLLEPELTVTRNSVQIPLVVDWYKSFNGSTYVDPITDWSTIKNSDMPVYAILTSVDSSSLLFDTQYSYNISIVPVSESGIGTRVNGIIPSAYYTIDFLAGGHGIAFGKPANQEIFECDMDAQFNNKLTIRGSELKDFIIEYGSSSNWVYRKWKSGRVEAWCTKSLGNKTGTAWVSPFMYTNATLDIPSGIFSSTPPYVTLQSQNSQWIIWGSWGASKTSIGFRAVTLATTAQELTIRAYVVGT